MSIHRVGWLVVIALLSIALVVGCGRGKAPKQEAGPPAGQYGGYGAPGYMPPPGQYGAQPGQYGAPAGQYGGYGAPGMPPTGPLPGQYGGYGAQGYGAQPAQPAAGEPEETAPAGPTYKERYEQGELSAEERREERELQDIERQLGLPVGP